MALKGYRLARRKKLLEYISRAESTGTPSLDDAKNIAARDGYKANDTAWLMALGEHLGRKGREADHD